MITPTKLEKLKRLLDAGQEDSFYHWREWEELRAQVLKMDRYECQLCKAKGRYSKAVIVHHVKHLRDRPDLALSIFDGDERQLVSVCKRCHERLHPEQLEERRYNKKDAPLTAERWD